MRVLMVSKACVVGQYQLKLEELARQPDLELTAVVPPFWRDERGTITLERAHTQGYALRVEPIRFNGEFHLHYYPTIFKVVREVRPHLIHIDEEPYNLASFLILRAARSVSAKTLFFTWQNILRRYPLPFSWMESQVLHQADYAIAGNSEAANVLRAKGYARQLAVIPQFGVDPDVYSPKRQSTNQLPSDLSTQLPNHPTTQLPNYPTTQPFRIAYAGGRLVQEKGIDILLRAVAGLQSNWELRILGSGPDKARLQALAHQLGIKSRVHFDPPIPSTAVPDYMRQLDLAVLPSITRPNWKEQFGRTLVEAMACQIPVIGSNSGEIPNVIGDAGLIFPEGDVAALRTHIETLQRHLALCRELGERGRARVLEHFTQARIAAETYAVYRTMMAEKLSD